MRCGISPLTRFAPAAVLAVRSARHPRHHRGEATADQGLHLRLAQDPNSPVTRLQMAAFMYRLGV